MALHNIFETERWTPSLDENGASTGYLEYAGQPLLKEAKAHIERALKAISAEHEGESLTLWSMLDYFHTSHRDLRAVSPEREFPRCRWVAVFAVEGASEGMYIHVEAIGLKNASGTSDDNRELLFLGKTFFGFDAAMEIVKAITREFHR